MSTTYQQVLDDVRKRLALQYLTTTQLPLYEIALLLGFNDSSNFRRAFRKWTGKLPSDYREARPEPTPAILGSGWMCHAWRFIEIHGALAAPTVIGVLHVDIPALIRETFPVGPLQCNCTIIGDPLTRKAIVVDPGGDHELILQRLDRLGLQVVSIIHTHAHLDHFLASGEMKKRTGASLHLHKDDQFLWDNLEMQCQLFGVPLHAGAGPGPLAGRRRGTGLRLRSGTAHAGHTPGSMSFWFPGRSC